MGSKFEEAQECVQNVVERTNQKISKMGEHTGRIYDLLTEIQEHFDRIRNVPTEEKIKYENLKKVCLNWKQQSEKIEKDYNREMAKSAGAGAAGAGLGVAVVTMGPTVAMGVATTFGVASTGTAISALSGAAATNAALAWLGGGALAAGGGGMAAGNALLALAGPVGWAIAGAALVTSGLMFLKAKSDKKNLENTFTLIAERDTKKYNLAMVEIDERINKIDGDCLKLKEAIEQIKGFGTDYRKMNDRQQYALGAYVNLMLSSNQLLVNPILGLQTKYTIFDLDKYLNWDSKLGEYMLIGKQKDLVIYLANLLYKIDLNGDDRKILWNSLRSNKDLLNSIGVEKEKFSYEIMDIVEDALGYLYAPDKAGSDRKADKAFFICERPGVNSEAESSTGLKVGARMVINDKEVLSDVIRFNDGGCVYGIRLIYNPSPVTIFKYEIEVDAEGPHGAFTGSGHLRFTDESGDSYSLSINDSSRKKHVMDYSSDRPNIIKVEWSNTGFK